VDGALAPPSSTHLSALYGGILSARSGENFPALAYYGACTVPRTHLHLAEVRVPR